MFGKKSPKRNQLRTNRLRVYSSFDQPVQTSAPAKRQSLRLPRLKSLSSPQAGYRLPWRRLAWGVLGLVLLFFTHISIIEVKSDGKLDQAASQRIRDETRDYLHARPWRNFQLFISSKDLADALKRSDPSIEQLSVQRSLLSKRIVLSLQSRRPAAVWQQGRGGQRFVVDEGGLVIAQEQQPAKLPLFVNDPSTVSGQVVGQRVVEAAAISTATALQTKLSNLKLGVDYFMVTAAPRQIDVALSGQAYQLFVSTNVPVDETLKALQQTLGLLSDRHEVPQNYIDLRIPYRVFYK